MTTAAVFGRVILAVVLLASGAAKLTDVEGFTHTLRLLAPAGRAGATGYRTHAAAPRLLALARCLALCELGLALFVLTGRWTRVIDVLLVAAFAAFTGLSIYALRRAPGTSCRCFGGLTPSRFTGRTVWRNTLLSAFAAAIVVVGPDSHAMTWAWTAFALALAGLFALACAGAATTLDLTRRPSPTRASMVYSDD